MIRKSLSLLMILTLAAAMPLSARAAAAACAPSGGGAVQLPAVENETPSSATPVVSADQIQVGVQPSATPEPPSVTFKSVNEAREKIRRAYLLRQYDVVLELSRAAAVQFPEEQAFEFYVKRAETMLKPTDDASEHSPAFRRLRDKRRSENIQSIMKSVRQTTASAVAAVAAEPESEKPTPSGAAPAASTKPSGGQQAKPAPAQRAAEEEQAPPPPPPVRRSAMDKIKNIAASPAVLYGVIGVVVLAVGAAVVMRLKGGKAKAESAAAEPETALNAFEPEKQAASQPSTLDDMDSLFKPAAPAPAPDEEPKTQIDNLDALFASASEPTMASQPEASVQDSLDSFFKTEEPKTEVTASAPIKLDDTPIELPLIAMEPTPLETGPIMMPEIEPEPVAPISLDSAPAEAIAPINIDIPEEDPFLQGSKPAASESEPEPAEEMQTTRIEFADLPSFEEETRQEAAIDDMLKPIVPEIMEPPSGMQPEYAATRGFVDNPTVSSTAIDETATGMDLPAIDVTPAVSVHEDETVALSEEAPIDQSTAISPAIPVAGGSPENGSGGSDDLFSREYHKGMSDFVISNWAGAVHHLSIAAALRPSAVEVKEKLREARKRRKETEE